MKRTIELTDEQLELLERFIALKNKGSIEDGRSFNKLEEVRTIVRRARDGQTQKTS